MKTRESTSDHGHELGMIRKLVASSSLQLNCIQAIEPYLKLELTTSLNNYHALFCHRIISI